MISAKPAAKGKDNRFYLPSKKGFLGLLATVKELLRNELNVFYRRNTKKPLVQRESESESESERARERERERKKERFVQHAFYLRTHHFHA